MEDINFFLNEIEKSRKKMPPSVSVSGYLSFVTNNYLILRYMCQQRNVDFISLILEQPFFQEGVKKRKEWRKKLKEEIKLVIFDKDGTLLDNEGLFLHYCQSIVDLFKDKVEDVDNFAKELGYDMKNNKFIQGGVLSMSSGSQVIEKIHSLFAGKYTLQQIEEEMNSIPPITEDDIYSHNDNENENGNKNDENEDNKNKNKNDNGNRRGKIKIKEFTNTKELFASLKKRKIKIGVCTSDDRSNALLHLSKIGVLEMVDCLKCGDDNKINKPSPLPIHEICSTLGILPRNTCMVGDTYYDIHAGTLANCGRIVGVLSGNTPISQIRDADYILNSISSFFL